MRNDKEVGCSRLSNGNKKGKLYWKQQSMYNLCSMYNNIIILERISEAGNGCTCSFSAACSITNLVYRSFHSENINL